jgi:DNA mismatch repair protein MutS2
MIRERDLQVLEFDKVVRRLREFAVSEPGRRLIDSLRPATDAHQVRARLRASAEMTALRAQAGTPPLSEFASQTPLLLAAAREGAVLDGRSLVMVRDFALVARAVQVFMRSRVEHYSHVAVLAANLTVPAELVDAMVKALADDGALADDASPQLKRLRTRLRDERLELEARLLSFSQRPAIEAVVSERIVTIRNRRFVLPFKLNYAEKVEGVVQDRSVSGETLFVEPAWAVAMNNRLMMLEREAEAEERRILAELTGLVRAYRAELELSFQALVNFDALNARAIFAEHYRCSEPQIVDWGLALHGARHPILLVGGGEVVPIDLAVNPQQRGVVISGPNTGGKTAALKTVGLLCTMAQAGLMIPAAPASRLPVFRTIFADIGDQQSLEASLSTFSAHIANLCELIGALDEPALVILDEPGAGTDPAEGGALTIGLIEYLSARRCLVAIATHSMSVKLYAQGRDDLELAAVDFDTERLVARYKLKPHTIGPSYGIEVARRLGLPQQIIQRALAVQPAQNALLDKALRRLEDERSRLAARAVELEQREADAQREQRQLMEEAKQARERLERERQRLSDRAQTLVAEFTKQATEVLAQLKAGSKRRADVAAFTAQARKDVAGLGANQTASTAWAAQLKVGDLVELRGANLRGELVSLEPGRAVLSRAGMRIEVAPERLRPAAGRANEPQTPKVSVEFSPVGGTELNLTGMRIAEALRKLEEFLDQAYLSAQQPEVRIIHGHGTGALRKAVHDYLSSSPYCAGFHEAEPYAGAGGATIVRLAR